MKKTSKMLIVFLSAGLIGTGGFLQAFGQKSSQQVNGEIYIVMPKNDGNTSDDFQVEEIEALQKDYEEVPIAYESSSCEMVQNMGKQAKIQLAATTGDYIKTCGIHMKKGSFFLEENSTEKEVVIDEKAAYALWGTDDCIGETLALKDDNWKIIGIAYNKEKNEKVGNIYCMGSALKNPPSIHLLYIRFDKALQSQNKGTVKQMLEQTGHSEKNYEIVSLTQYRKQIAGYFTRYLKGLLFICLAAILVRICRRVQKDFAIIKEISRQCYISDYVKAHGFILTGKVLFYLLSTIMVIIGLKTFAYFEVAAVYGQQAFMGTAYKLPQILSQLQDYFKWGKMIYIAGLVMALSITGIIIYVMDSSERLISKSD